MDDQKDSLNEFIEMYQDDPEILEEILSIFLEETPERIEIIEGSIETKDFARITKAAHSIANSTGTLKASRSLHHARTLEQVSREENIEKVRETFPLLRENLNVLISEAEQWLAEFKGS
jgi:HPt (histidine-containing phosphotransfer) domain-containing protein